MRCLLLLSLLSLPVAAAEEPDCRSMERERSGAQAGFRKATEDKDRAQRLLMAQRGIAGDRRASTRASKAAASASLVRTPASHSAISVLGVIDLVLVAVNPRAPPEPEAGDSRTLLVDASPRSAQLILSAQLCWYDQDRKRAVAVLVKERKYAGVPGAVKHDAAIRAGRDVRRADDETARLRVEMLGLKVRPAPCTDPAVRSFVGCLDVPLGGSDETPDHCTISPHAEFLSFVKTNSDDD